MSCTWARSRSPTDASTPHSRCRVWSCSTTISSSRVRRRSSSTMSAPSATAAANAGRVFSRSRTGSPRCAMAVTLTGGSMWYCAGPSAVATTRGRVGLRSAGVRLRVAVSGAAQERAGEHERHGALQHPRQDQRQPQSSERRHASRDERSDRRRAPHEAAPGAAHAAHEVTGGQPLAERDRDDRDDGDGDAHEREGGSGQDPTVRRRHEEVADARDDRGTDEGAGAAEAPHLAVRQGAPHEVPDGGRGEEETVGPSRTPHSVVARSTRTPPSMPWNREREATIKTRTRRRRSAKRRRTPSQIEFEVSAGRRRLGGQPDEGDARRDEGDGVGDERRDLLDGEERRPDDGTRQIFRARLGAGQDAVGALEGVAPDQLGNHCLNGRVVRGPCTRVDQHDDDQERQVDSVGRHQCRRRPGSRWRARVGQGHDRAPLEAVREGPGRQGQEQPRKAVRCDDRGDGQRMRIQRRPPEVARRRRRTRHRSSRG